MLERLLLPELRQAVREKDWANIAEMSSVLHPSVIAEMIAEEGGKKFGWKVLKHIDPVLRAEIFGYFDPDFQGKLVEKIPLPDLAQVLELMPHDDRVDLVKRMDDQHQAKVMALIAKKERDDILRLAGYDEGTVGSIMTTDYALLPAELTVADSLKLLRQQAVDKETIYYIYVVDKDRKLIGFVSLKNLILAPPSQSIGEVMKRDVLWLTVDMDVGSAVNQFDEYDLIAMPVVDADQRLVGIVTHDDVIDVQREEATEDAHLMGAVEALEGDYTVTPFWETVWKRIPWLAALLIFEMCAAAVLMWHDELIQQWLAMMFFLPVIIATGGNTGSQAASMITRSLALGEVKPADIVRVTVRELLSGLALGLLVGLLAAIIVLLFPNKELAPASFAPVLMIGLIIVTMFGSLLGALLPLVFESIGLDPARSSTPLVASAVDVAGVTLYCYVAGVFLQS